MRFGVRQLHLRLAVPLLALAQRRFRPLALGQIEHESDRLVSSFFDRRRTQQNGDAAAVFPEVFLLNRQPDPSPFVLFDPLCVALAPVPGGQILPVDAARREVLTVVSDDPEKRIIGLENRTIEVPDEDADNVGFHEAPDLRLAFRQVAVEMGVLQRDRRLRGEERQHRDPGWREDPGSLVVLEIENAIEPALVDQW